MCVAAARHGLLLLLFLRPTFESLKSGRHLLKNDKTADLDVEASWQCNILRLGT